MSAVIALATPRRIKASHRRRRRVASDHLLYILNNPLSGTDPTGYKAVLPEHIAGSVCNTGQCRGSIVMPSNNKEDKIGTNKPLISAADYISGNGSSSGQSQGSSKQMSFNDWMKNSHAGNGDTPASNTMMGQRQAACEAMGGCSEHIPNYTENAVRYSGELASDAAKTTGRVAKDEVKNPWNWVPFVGQVKISGRLAKFFSWFGNGEKAAESAGDLRRAGSGFSFGRKEATLLRGAENLGSFDTFNDARRAAIGSSGLGNNAVDFIQEIGPYSGRVTGRMSADGLRGWRIDFDRTKGFHVNWWNRSAGPNRSDWVYGANSVKGGTQDAFWSTLEHFPRN